LLSNVLSRAIYWGCGDDEISAFDLKMPIAVIDARRMTRWLTRRVVAQRVAHHLPLYRHSPISLSTPASLHAPDADDLQRRYSALAI